MELWVAFGFGALIGAFIGTIIGRQRAAARRAAAPPVAPPPPAARFAPPEVQHVVLDEGSANVLNALNNRLAAIGALADLLHGSPLDPERARALMMLHGEVRRAAEITQHFLELAQHPIGAAEPSDCSIVLNGVLAEREGTLKELGVRLVRSIPHDLPMVACPMAQLTEMLMKLLDFALRRLRDSQPPRELRIAVSESGPSLTISLWDSGVPLSVEAEQRLVTPFRFTQSAGGGEIEFALARALAQSSGGTLRLRPRPGGGAEGGGAVRVRPRPPRRGRTPPLPGRVRPALRHEAVRLQRPDRRPRQSRGKKVAPFTAPPPARIRAGCRIAAPLRLESHRRA